MTLYCIVLYQANGRPENIGETDQYDRALIIAHQELARAMDNLSIIEPMVIAYEDDAFPAIILEAEDFDESYLAAA